MGRTKKVKEDPWKQKVQDLFASVQGAPEDTRQALLNSIQGEMNKLIGSSLSTKDELTKSSPSRPVRNRTPSVRLKDSEVGYSIKTEPKDDWSKVKEDSKVKGKRGGRKANISDQEDSFAEIDVNAFRPVVVNVDPDLMGETDDQSKSKFEALTSEIIIPLEKIDDVTQIAGYSTDLEVTKVCQGRAQKKLKILAVPTEEEIDEVEKELVKAEGVAKEEEQEEETQVKEDDDLREQSLAAVDDILRSITMAPEQFTPDQEEDKEEEEFKEPMMTEEVWTPAEEKEMTQRKRKKEPEPGPVKKKKYTRKPKQCEQCGKTVIDLNKHVLFHQVDKLPVLNCPDCDYETKYKDNLFRHRQLKHSTARPHVCPECNAAFVNRTKLRKHVSFEHGDGRKKRFPCDQCEFITHTKAILLRHQLNKHEKSKTKYECDVCHLQLSYKGTFETHMRRHTGQRPYSCSKCDRRFSSTSTLSQHMKTHESKRFACPVCNKAFLTKHHMERHHEALHTSAKSHACPFCRYTCNNPFNLRKHCITQHDKIYPPKSRSSWRAANVASSAQSDFVVGVENSGDLSANEYGSVALQLPHGQYMVNEDGQLMSTQTVEGATEAAAEVIYVKPDMADSSGVQEISVSDLQNAEVLEKEHIPVTDSVWHSIQAAMQNGEDVNLEELLKSNNVLIQVKGVEEVDAQIEEGEEEGVTYLVIEPQEGGEVTSEDISESLTPEGVHETS